MKKSFAARRGTPRKIASEDEEEASNSPQNTAGAIGSPVKRPALGSKPKKSSSLRMSFGASETGDDSSATFTPKKSNFSRLATERNVERRAAETITPSYSRDYLEELKSATPSRPVRNQSTEDDLDAAEEATGPASLSASDVDIAAKFGAQALVKPVDSIIPSEAEIREKKERRARLAKQGDYLSLNSDDEEVDEDGRLVLREKQKYPETRLERDDEDFAEGFDEFTEYSNHVLGRDAEREASRRRQREMIDMIAQAEGLSDDEDEDDSDAERNAAYEAAQTKAGTYGERNTGHTSRSEIGRPRTPPKITPVPELRDVLAKLKSSLTEMELVKKSKELRLEELKAEKDDLGQRELWIQGQLKETGDRYEKLRLEAGMALPVRPIDTNGLSNSNTEGRLYLDRGLESLGSGRGGASPDDDTSYIRSSPRSSSTLSGLQDP